MARAPSPTAVTKPADNKPLSPPKFHNSAKPNKAANAPIPVTSFIRRCFRCFIAIHHKAKQEAR